MTTTLLLHLHWMSIWCAKLVCASNLSVHKCWRSDSKSGTLPILISSVPCLDLFVIWTMLSFGHTKAMVPRLGELSVLCMLEQTSTRSGLISALDALKAFAVSGCRQFCSNGGQGLRADWVHPQQ